MPGTAHDCIMRVMASDWLARAAQRQRTATQALTGTGASTAANGASSGAWTPSAPSRSCVGRFGGRLVPQPGATGLGFSGPSATAMAAQP